eukprot:SAG31_NODE_43_length_31224_cov_10.112578_9_plen_335_part_00
MSKAQLRRRVRTKATWNCPWGRIASCTPLADPAHLPSNSSVAQTRVKVSEAAIDSAWEAAVRERHRTEVAPSSPAANRQAAELFFELSPEMRKELNKQRQTQMDRLEKSRRRLATHNKHVKRVHFIRHGQAKHNAASLLPGAICDCRQPGGSKGACPYNQDAVLDAALTEAGTQQAAALQAMTEKVGVELIVVSPLRRAVQTALLAFHHPDGFRCSMVAVEACREKSGMHLCDRRRPTLHIMKEFRRLDVSELSETDLLWTQERENAESVEDRCEQFLEWLQAREEESIAVVTHHHFLLALFLVILAPDAPELREPFATGEMRSVCIDFSMWAD